MLKNLNIFQMYVENNCQFGFYVTRRSWSDKHYAMVVGIDGVKNGEMFEGEPPYFVRKYPADHLKEGRVWKRTVHLKADWLDNGIYDTDCGGTYAWTRVYPVINTLNMNEIQKILAYYQQLDLETISQQDFEDWINSLEEPMKSHFRANGFEKCKGVLNFQRFVLELRDFGLEEFIKK